MIHARNISVAIVQPFIVDWRHAPVTKNMEINTNQPITSRGLIGRGTSLEQRYIIDTNQPRDAGKGTFSTNAS